MGLVVELSTVAFRRRPALLDRSGSHWLKKLGDDLLMAQGVAASVVACHSSCGELS